MQDNLSREAFIQRLDRNFSVMASAGSGKTRAIVERITHLARQAQHNGQDLGALAVLTYTQKAAQEMQERASKALTDAQQSPALLHKAFFGTIHSFCLSLIQTYGVYIGIPPGVEVLPPHQDLWEGFIQSVSSWDSFLDPQYLEQLNSFLKLSDYLQLPKEHPPEAFPRVVASELKRLKEPDLYPLLNFKGDKRNQAQVHAGQAFLQSWKMSRELGHFPSGLPVFTKGGKAFQDLYTECFQPLKDNLSRYLGCFLQTLAEGYRRFRLSKRKLNYDDLVYYARQLLKEPTSRALLKAKKYIILLDEAQDTDPQQFQLLLALVNLWDVDKDCISPENPRPGAFCMVGDPQQSIYSQRASLSFYQSLHENLKNSGALDELTFSTTLRCEKAIVEGINTLFPKILTRTALGQVDFVPLQAAPHKERGCIRVWQVPGQEESYEKENLKAEAYFIAEKLAKSPPSLKHWGELALLCPRKQWLIELADALEAYRLPFQLHSGQKTLGEDPTYAWLTALFTVLERPTDSFEIAGLLREFYGLADASIAQYIKKFYQKNSLHPLNVLAPPSEESLVYQALESLKALRETLKGLSLTEAFQRILKHTAFEERIASLPLGLREGGISLESLYLRAKEADLNQLSLSDFAKNLRQGLPQTSPEQMSLHHHIQLYTCHKAKGLEFEVVLLPFLYRKVSRAPLTYPALYKVGDQTHLLLDASQLMSDLKELEQSYFEAELARLLYVSFTRAKRELILTQPEPKPALAVPSFAQFFDIQALNAFSTR